MKYFTCPNCGEIFQMSYFKWIAKNPFHWFNFQEMKDYRRTKCPCCGKRSLMRVD